MNDFEAYQKYIAVKRHFTSSYDYFKYNGKTNVKVSSFETRRDRHHFSKLAKKHKEALLYLVANFFVNEDFWIGNINTEESNAAFVNMQKRQHSLTYMFQEDISQIDNLKEWLIVKDREYPKLYNEYKRKNIAPETLIIIDSCINIFDYWLRRVEDDIIFPGVINKLRKYRPFITYDIDKYKHILRDKYR